MEFWAKFFIQIKFIAIADEKIWFQSILTPPKTPKNNNAMTMSIHHATKDMAIYWFMDKELVLLK